ncbi:hypothetical protein SOP94_19590 [Peribacillus frigoritolerans]|uniref:hypothetical protein n=1 Tax=Peribacillus frigoritolerans TaxID=450367 RepID=UPI002B245A4B|nr:hypothetical protein [Peribacillus frigoritolerans]MEB2630662.1 hypothetical protein [Peribacillus frigoritolerans]
MGKSQNNDEQNNNKYEIINANDGKVSKVFNGSKLFISNFVDKIIEIPNFARDILKSTDDSAKDFNELVKQDKNTIDMIIKQKIESGNYTDNELNNLLDRTQKITEKSEGLLGKLNKHKSEMLMIVAGSIITVVKMVLDNRNKS